MNIILQILLYPFFLLISFLGPLIVPVILFSLWGAFKKGEVDELDE